MKRLLLIVAVLVLGGCATVPPAQPTGLQPQAFWKEQELRTQATANLSGKIHLRLDGKQEKLSGGGRFVAQAPQRLLLELRDPLGRTQFLLTLASERFVAYYPTQKLAYTDSLGGMGYVKHFLGVEIAFSELQGLFLGLVPKHAPKHFDSWEWDAGKGLYRGSLRINDRSLTCYVDGKTAILKELVSESAKSRAHAVYADVDGCCGKAHDFQLAHHVKVELDSSKTRVEVEWDAVQRLDKPRPESTFDLSLPAEVRKHVLK